MSKFQVSSFFQKKNILQPFSLIVFANFFKAPVSFLFFSPIYGPQQRVVDPLSAVAPEVVRVYGPDHDSGRPPLGCEAGLGLDALHVVVGDPLEALVHVGGGVVGVPLLGPLQQRGESFKFQESF